jgi:hypothetical protein
MWATISLHSFSHLRQASAHSFMCLSSGNFSHSFAHRLQASMQALQMTAAKGPLRATMEAAAEQIVAQSRQEASVWACSFLPASNCFAQWAAQLSHSRAQSAHSSAHSFIAPWTWDPALPPGCWAPATPCKAPSVAAVKPATVNSLLPIMETPPERRNRKTDRITRLSANGGPFGMNVTSAERTSHDSGRPAKAKTPAGRGLRLHSRCSAAPPASWRWARGTFLRSGDDRRR